MRKRKKEEVLKDQKFLMNEIQNAVICHHQSQQMTYIKVIGCSDSYVITSEKNTTSCVRDMKEINLCDDATLGTTGILNHLHNSWLCHRLRCVVAD